MESEIKVSIVDDDPSVRMSLRMMIGNVAGFTVASMHADAADAIGNIPAANPSIVFMDIRMPGKSGIECTRDLKKLLPGLRVVMVTAQLADALIADAFHAGAIGYLSKPFAPSDIARALECAQRGDIHLQGMVSERFSAWMQSRRPKPMVQLTEREVEVLTRLRQGLSDKEIAVKMGIQESTIKSHVRHVLAKLGSRSRTQAVSRYFGYF